MYEYAPELLAYCATYELICILHTCCIVYLRGTQQQYQLQLLAHGIHRPASRLNEDSARHEARTSTTKHVPRPATAPTAPPPDAPRLSGGEPGRAGLVRGRVSDWSHDNLHRFELNLDGSRLEPCPRDVYSQLPDKPPA